MKKTIVCLKWGSKYTSLYVNTLYNMCKKHCSIDFDFFCMTDDHRDLNPEIKIIKLPNLPLHGWWLKPCVFNKENGLQGDILFLDLDLVVYDNINKLWNYMPNEFVIIRDFTRHMAPQWKKFNSSVFKFKAEDYYWIWDEFIKDHTKTMSKMHGDQDFLYHVLKDRARYWPDHWIQSYKWEMRSKSDIHLINGKRNFVDIKYPKLTNECCIAVFHGDPNPHEVEDPWVVMNWR